MKKSILLLIALTLGSCGYSIKTDREMANKTNQIVQAQDDLKEVKEQWKQFKDSVALAVLKDSIRQVKFRDSVEFTNLSRTMCYDKSDHRHSCEVYK